jgi:uncharacterized membrane protein
MMRALYLGASTSLVALILLCVFWELFLAPLRPGGSWLVLKALPLLLPLRGVLAGRRYTYQWASMLILLYFTEGTVRAFSDPGPGRALAAAEIVLATTFFVCAIFFARESGRAPR